MPPLCGTCRLRLLASTWPHAAMTALSRFGGVRARRVRPSVRCAVHAAAPSLRTLHGTTAGECSVQLSLLAYMVHGSGLQGKFGTGWCRPWLVFTPGRCSVLTGQRQGTLLQRVRITAYECSALNPVTAARWRELKEHRHQTLPAFGLGCSAPRRERTHWTSTA